MVSRLVCDFALLSVLLQIFTVCLRKCFPSFGELSQCVAPTTFGFQFSPNFILIWDFTFIPTQKGIFRYSSHHLLLLSRSLLHLLDSSPRHPIPQHKCHFLIGRHWRGRRAPLFGQLLISPSWWRQRDCSSDGGEERDGNLEQRRE